MEALQLIVFRHAKAAQSPEYGNDFNRPLAEEGYAELEKAAKLLQAVNAKPDAVVCSSAMRTFETAEMLCKLLGLDSGIIIPQQDLYNASSEAYEEALVYLNNDFKTVLFVGHNPGISEFVHYLTGSFATLLQTAGFVVGTLKATKWDQIKAGSLTVTLSH